MGSMDLERVDRELDALGVPEARWRQVLREAASGAPERLDEVLEALGVSTEPPDGPGGETRAQRAEAPASAEASDDSVELQLDSVELDSVDLESLELDSSEVEAIETPEEEG